MPVPPKGLTQWLVALQEPFYKQLFPAVFGYLKFMLRGRPMPDKSNISISEFVRHVSGSQAAADNAASAVIGGIYGGNIDKLDAKTALYPMLQSLWIPKDKLRRFGFPSRREDDPVDKKLEILVGEHAAVCSSTDAVALELIADPAIQKMVAKTHAQKPSLLHFGSHGLQALTDALVHALQNQPNVKFKTGCRVKSMERWSGGNKVLVSICTHVLQNTYNQETHAHHSQITEQNGEAKSFDKVFASVSASALKSMTRAKLPVLDEMESVNIMTVNLWYPYLDMKPRGLGYLIPRSVSAEQNPEHALGVFFDSDIENALPDEPEGTKLFVLMGGHYYDDPNVKIPSPEEAIAQAKSLLERHLGIPADLPCHAEANLRKDCIPQHTLGHSERMATLTRDIHKSFNARLQPIGGAFTRIGAMAALRDGYTATRPAVQGVEDWETSMEMPALSDGYISIPLQYVSHARPNLYPSVKKVQLWPQSEIPVERSAK